MAVAAARRSRRWSTSSNCRCRIPRSIACCWCMRSKWRTTRSRCCARSGGCWRRAGGCWRWCRTGAGCGRAWIRRRSATAGPIRARRSRICCARPGSRRSDGARRSMCRRSRAAGSCARRWPGSAPARRISAPFAGVHIVEATKQVYRAIPARREQRALVPALEPALAPRRAALARDRETTGCGIGRSGSIRSQRCELDRSRRSASSPPSPPPGMSGRGPRCAAPAAMQREAVAPGCRGRSGRAGLLGRLRPAAARR